MSVRMPRTPKTTCPRCGRACRAQVPRHGDGSVLVTYWHKDARNRSKWCRAEVDTEDADHGDVERYLYERQKALGYGPP